jgi:RHH-type proline utilization regulon transcriptional repressor/proline dehydrogenase/delta 1-pyrroline-5-carboxylate dehydrogenase
MAAGPRRAARRRLPLAHRLVSSVREKRTRASGVDALMHEFSLSSEEGVALMCLAEALLRIPDSATADRLIADKISKGDWKKHLGESPSLFVNAATWGLLITGKLVSTSSESGLGSALTAPDRQGRRAADPQGRRPGHAHARQPVRHRPDHRRSAQEQPRQRSARLSLFLRHAGRSGADRSRRKQLLRVLRSRDPRDRQGLERPRHQGRPGHFDQAVGPAPALQPRAARPRDGELLPRVRSLVLLAKQYDIGINIDAEEADRLEISLDMLEALAFDPSWPASKASAWWCRPTRSAAPS